MKTRKLTAGIAAIALSFAAISAPQAMATERSSAPVIENDKNEEQKDISFESHDGAYITPNETLTLTADSIAEGVQVRNAYIEIEPGKTSALWDVKRSVNDEGLPVLKITAPDEPEKQFGTTQEYGEYLVHVRYSVPEAGWHSYTFNINFAEEKPKKEFELSSKLDFKELLDKASSSSK